MKTFIRLSWSENLTLLSLYDGWTIEIFGVGKEADLTQVNYVWTGSGPFVSKKDVTGEIRLFGSGPDVWILLPNREPNFRKENGAKRHQPPLGYIAQVLSYLYKMGFKVFDCNSEVGNTAKNQSVVIEYILKKKEET